MFKKGIFQTKKRLNLPERREVTSQQVSQRGSREHSQYKSNDTSRNSYQLDPSALVKSLEGCRIHQAEITELLIKNQHLTELVSSLQTDKTQLLLKLNKATLEGLQQQSLTPRTLELQQKIANQLSLAKMHTCSSEKSQIHQLTLKHKLETSHDLNDQRSRFQSQAVTQVDLVEEMRRKLSDYEKSKQRVTSTHKQSIGNQPLGDYFQGMTHSPDQVAPPVRAQSPVSSGLKSQLDNLKQLIQQLFVSLIEDKKESSIMLLELILKILGTKTVNPKLLRERLKL